MHLASDPNEGFTTFRFAVYPIFLSLGPISTCITIGFHQSVSPTVPLAFSVYLPFYWGVIYFLVVRRGSRHVRSL